MNSIRSYSSRLLQLKRKPLAPIRTQQHRLEKFSPQIQNDSFHESVGLVLTIGQCFGQVPIVGVLDKNYRNARFEMCNIRTIYTIVFIVAGIAEGCLALKRTHALHYSMTSVQNILFIGVCLSGSGLLFALARKWYTFIRFWQEHEAVFLRDPYIIRGMRIKTKIFVISIAFLICSLLEHMLYLFSAVVYNYQQYTKCKIKNISFLNFYFLKERSHVFLVVPFRLIYLVPIIWQGFTMAFCWNYVDLMIIVISIGISTRFEQINNRLQSSLRKNVTDTFWLEIRKHYVQVVDILQNVDKEISLLVLLSCASNLYYICLQLFHSFTPIPFFLSTVYFWYSLIFLICRTLCVLMYAASVHDSSRKPIGMLRDVPTKLWTSETQRFLDLVTVECNALSGKKFFYLTKNMILAMAGTVVTYELVLLDEVEQEAEHKSLCNLTRFNFSSLE